MERNDLLSFIALGLGLIYGLGFIFMSGKGDTTTKYAVIGGCIVALVWVGVGLMGASTRRQRRADRLRDRADRLDGRADRLDGRG